MAIPPARKRGAAFLLAAVCLLPAAPATATAAAGGAPHNMLLKQQFAVGADGLPEAPAASALCQQYLGKPNPYPNPSPNVDLIVNDGVVQTGSQKGCGSAQNETTVVTNPANPLNLVAGSNDYRVYNDREKRNDDSGWAYTTFDGGKTWKNVNLPHLTYQTGATGLLSVMDSAGDPSIAFGPNNTVYYANLVFSRTSAPNGMVVSVSHDGGLTWSEPSIVHMDSVAPDGTPLPSDGIFNDKEWIAVDQNTGQVYVTWTQFYSDAAGNYLQSPIVASSSTDGGATWSAPTQVSVPLAGFHGGPTSFGQGSNTVVGNDGTVYVPYETPVCATLACDQTSDHDAIVLATSHDGGRTFTNTELAKDYDFPYNADTGRSTLTGENFRLWSVPSATIDRSTGKLYIAWADDRNGQYDANGNSIHTHGAVFLLSELGNSGTFAAPVQVGPSGDSFFPAVAASRSHIVVSYFTRSYDPNGIGVDYAYAAGTDGQIDQAPQTRLTTASENPQVQFTGVGLVTGQVLQGTFIGDYSGVAMGTDLVAHPVWTDFRGNPGVTDPNQDAYTQAVPLH